MFLDISEVSYNNGKSNHSKKSKKDSEFSSDSDYSYSSDRRSGKKKKSKKKDSKKSSKSKKNKKACKTKIPEKKNTTLPTLPLATNLSEENNISEVENVRKTLSPINAKNLNSVSLKRHCETSQIEKHFKRNELQSTSAFSNVLSHDYSLYQNNDSSLLKPLTYNFNSDTNSYIDTPPLLVPSAINLIPITTGHNYLANEESTLEPIRMKQSEENNIVEGNISVIFFLFTSSTTNIFEDPKLILLP